MPQKYSPNWYWEKLGYIKTGRYKDKAVWRPDGTVVDIGDRSYSDQLKAAVRECVSARMTDIVGDDELNYLEGDHEL